MKELLTAAHRACDGGGEGQDPDLELAADEEAKWSTHSLRRLANTAAQRCKTMSGAEAADIDLYFGWNERVLRKAMQRHYEAMSMAARILHSKITGWL